MVSSCLIQFTIQIILASHYHLNQLLKHKLLLTYFHHFITSQLSRFYQQVSWPIIQQQINLLLAESDRSQQFDKIMQKQSSSIKVLVRVRPLLEIESMTEDIITIQNDVIDNSMEQEKTVKVHLDALSEIEMKFDYAISSSATQLDIYSHFSPIVPKIMDGYNITIFAYGQTGSGKTYTMFGSDWENIIQNNQQLKKQNTKFDDIQSDDNNAGIIPRSIHQVFKKLNGRKQYHAYCSFLQIYNEKIYDLLQDNAKPKPLSIHQSKTEGIFVEGLTQFGVQQYEDCLQLMQRGEKNRFIRQTSMNAKSSRSHTIFQILVESDNGNGVFKKARLNLCDLAGSQKINKKQSMVNDHLQELKNINLSLTTLGKVIYALSSGDKKSIAAFRQSKLTRLLQQSLTANTYTFIIGNLSPSSKNVDQTINTLKFVERANHITMKIKPTEINAQNTDAVYKLQKQLEYLKELLNLKKKGLNPEEITHQLTSLKKQNEKLKKNVVSNNQFEDLMKENRNMKKQIYNLQVKLENNEKSATDSVYSSKTSQSGKVQIEKMRYYMPSEESGRSNQPVKNNKSIFMNAGQSILMGKDTLVNRSREKQSIIQKLQDLEDRKRINQFKLIDDIQNVDKKGKGRRSPSPSRKPAKQNSKGESVQKVRKRVDYSDKIKELEARLFGK